MTLHRDMHAAIWEAQNQADSLLWRGTERGVRYQGEADGLRKALDLINLHRKREWAAAHAVAEEDS